jgi:hypothetical protein
MALKAGRPNTAKQRVPTRAGGGAWRVKASAESLGGLGSCGYGISGNGYSELSTTPMGTASDFKALGDLACGTVLTITNPGNGKSVQARKQDVGAGSPGFLPVMGLYPTTVSTLGLSGGEFDVIIERADGGTLSPVRGTPAGAGAATSTGSTGAATPSGGSSGTPSLLSVLGDLVSGDVSDLAANLAIMVATGIKDATVSIYDGIIAPTWHRNQDAVYWYSTNVLFPSKTSTAGYKAWRTWPANAAFWGFGYGLLFTDPTTGSLKPVPPRQSRIARHVRGTQAIPARQALIKPKRVLEKTPKKPTPKTSRVPVRHVAALNTHRRGRPVTVTNQTTEPTNSNPITGETRTNARQPHRPARARPIVSEVGITKDGSLKATEKASGSQKGKASQAAKSYPNYPGRLRPRTDSGDDPKTPKVHSRARRSTVGHRRLSR